ncbi:MAG: ABC transporter substrate-binding protein [Deltaproteobacteria bacterium]
MTLLPITYAPSPDPGPNQWAVFLFSCLIACLFGALSACDAHKTRDEGPKVLTLRLKWLFNASTAGELWALDKGGFERRGLQVALSEGGVEHNAIKEIELGRAQFGIASADQILQAAGKGADIVVLAQIFQANPLQWIYDETRFTVRDVSDLKGRCIGITYGGNDEAIFSALMERYGITDQDVRLYAVHYDYSPFWKGEVDLWPIYRNVEGVVLAEKIRANGGRAGFFDPGSAGISFVANSLITSRTFYETQDEKVRAFTEAVIEGWQEAMAPQNLDAAVEIVRLRDPETRPGLIAEQISATRPLVAPPGRSVGTIDKEAWKETARILADHGLLDREPDLTRLLAGPPP